MRGRYGLVRPFQNSESSYKPAVRSARGRSSDFEGASKGTAAIDRKRLVRLAVAVVFLTVSATTALAQEAEKEAPKDAPPAVPRAYRGIGLGMSMEEVKEALKADGLYAYRGDPDVSLLPRPSETLIEVAGTSFVRRAFFQFYEDRLFVMILSLNEKEIDHYSVFTSLSGKYGKPSTLSPSESVWLDEATRLSVERPLALKYIDRATFDELKAKGEAIRSYEELLRADFLSDL